MENKISLEKIRLILKLSENLSKEEWNIIKKYIDDNFDLINEKNVYAKKENNLSQKIFKDLLDLKYKKHSKGVQQNENITFNSVNEMVECVQKSVLQKAITEKSINGNQISLLRELKKIKD